MSYAGAPYGEEGYGQAPEAPTDHPYAEASYAGATYAGASPTVTAAPPPPTQTIAVGPGPATGTAGSPAEVYSPHTVTLAVASGPASGRAGAPLLVGAPPAGPPPPPPPPYGGRIAVKIYDPAYATLKATLDNRHDVQWLDQLNDAGTHQFQLQCDDTEAAQLDYLRIAQYSLDGVVRFAGPIEHIKKHLVAPAEEKDQVYEVDGRGMLALLERAVIYPESGTDQKVYADTRAFNFASKYFDTSAWAPAVELKQQKQTGTAYGKDGAPAGWPDGDAWWIWGTALAVGATPPMPVGDCYFVAPPLTVDEGTYRFYVSADDGFELWVDGVNVASNSQALAWQQTQTVDLFLRSGTHAVAIKGTNIDRPATEATNAAGVICTVTPLPGVASIGTPILRTDSTWKCSPYPPQAPGFTVGAILKILITEAQARGSLPGMTLGFDDNTDSNGVAWPANSELSYKVGDDLLTTAKKLIETGADLYALPGAFALNAYVRRGGTQPASVTPGVNLSELIFEGQA